MHLFIYPEQLNIFMLKNLLDLRTLCFAEHLRPQKQARHKDNLAKLMCTREVTSKHTNLCLAVCRPNEVTLHPLSHSVILNFAFCLLRSLHCSFFL